jgi:hypothetical protein
MQKQSYPPGREDRPLLTLLQGDGVREYTIHPVEAARQALLAAAELEDAGDWRPTLLKFASLLPDRRSQVAGGGL